MVKGMNMSWRKSYTKVSVGIYKNKKTRDFYAEKRVDGKLYNKTFSSVQDAKKWRKAIELNSIKSLSPQSSFEKKFEKQPPKQKFSTLGQVWRAMEKTHFPSLATSTKAVWRRRYSLLKNLEHFPMNEITPSKITTWVNYWAKEFKASSYQKQRGCASRCNLNNELNMFVTIFNWYKESEQFEKEAVLLTCPIKRKHRRLGFIKPTPDKKKQISLDHAYEFFKHLKAPYDDLARMQFFTAGRVGEVSGLQWSNIDFDNQRMVIKESCIWCSRNKTFLELKPFPKNKESRVVYITDEILEILKRRKADKIPGNDYVFHWGEKPLNYGTIQVNYRSAQRKGKLPYSGTHILRHGMAKLAREVGGGLDAVIAMTGHKDIKLADHYSSSNEDDQKRFSTKIMEHIRSNKLKEKSKSAVDDYSNVVSLSRFKNATNS